MKPFIGNETFLLTYGDGLSDVNLHELLKFHRWWENDYDDSSSTCR